MLSTRTIKQTLDIPFSRKHVTTASNTYLNELSQKFDELMQLASINSCSEQKKIEIESEKLAVITTFEKHLLQYRRFKKPILISQSAPPSHLNKISFKLLSACLIMLSGSNGFLGGTGLLSLIPGIANPLLFILGGLLGGINALLFYSFESTFLKKNLGLESMDDSKRYCQLHEDQIKATKRINRLLFDYSIASQIARNDFKSYSKLAIKLNEHVQHKNNIFKHYDESVGVSIFRKVVTGFGAIMAAGNGYFLMHTLLALVAASLLATPVGWGLVSFAIVSSVSLFALIPSRGLFGMMNPAYEHYQQIQKRLDKFEYRSQTDFDEVISNKVESKRVAELAPEFNSQIIINEKAHEPTEISHLSFKL